MTLSRQFLNELARIANATSAQDIEEVAGCLAAVRDEGGRIFFLGVGGGAGHASHAVNDFRKIAGMESYTPTDNASELTARINYDGWETSYRNWLQGSRLRPIDTVFVFSVGGGDAERGISANLV